MATEAMGGRQKLESVQSARLQFISHTALMEQSYRQAPFITSCELGETTIDLAGRRLRTQAHGVWPETDLGAAESDSTLIATPGGGVYHSSQGHRPCSLADLDSTREILALTPCEH